MKNALSAVEAADEIRKGTLSSVELTTACLDQINESDPKIGAWAFIDRDHALAQAAKMDEIRKAGRAVGILHGVPVGLKDNIDTDDMPTKCGSSTFEDRRPDQNAIIVDRLKEAGAVILGKTITTEFAYLHASETRNPHNLDYSPGGSSSGSAAAVAAFHVPLAIGTQTNGSVIRPASYCGTYGFKPTRGVIPRSGVLQTSQTLDQVGVFTRTLEDAALVSDAISGYDRNDTLSFLRPRPAMVKGVESVVPVEPALALFDLPYKDRLTLETIEGLDEVAASLGVQVDRVSAPPAFTGLIETQRVIQEYEIWHNLEEVFTKNPDALSPTIKPALDRARAITKFDYEAALDMMKAAAAFYSEFFKDYDAILSPATTGEAPRFGGGTGDPICSTLWTLNGLPCITLPLLVGNNNLPIGVQLIGNIEEDDRLLRTANWVLKTLQAIED